MSGLTPEAKVLLADLKKVGKPRPDARARVRAALVARVGMAAPLSAVALGERAQKDEGTTRRPSASSSSFPAWAPRLVVGVAVAVGAGALWYGLARGTDGAAATQVAAVPDEPPRVAPTPIAPPVEAPAVVEATADPTPPPPPERAPAGPAPSDVRPAAPPPARAPSSRASAASSSAPGRTASVAEEVEVLTRAHAALRGGSPEEALAALDEHARRFPNGVLAEERSSERVLALCAAGRTSEARDEGGRFLRLHPRSFFAARVRASCAGGEAE